MDIEVRDLGAPFLQEFMKNGFTQPNGCFKNCFSAVVLIGAAIPGRMSYALCWLIDNHGERHPHALVQIDGLYFDPTIQANPKAFQYGRNYQLEKLLSREDAIYIFEQAGGLINYAGGNAQIIGLPPALLADGEIRCETVTLP